MKQKLELFIQEVFDGAKVIYPEKSTRGDIVDLRSAVRDSVKPEEKFTMIKYVNDGIYLITGFSTSGSRQDDYLAGWVFIPLALIRVFNDKLVDISNNIQNTLEKLADDNSEQFLKECKNISQSFKEYKDSVEPLTIRPIISSADEKKYAVRYYKEDELASLLSNDHLLQPEYTKYQGIVFLEEGQECKLAEVKDKLRKTVTLRRGQNIPNDVTVSVELDGNNCTLEKGKEYLCHEGDTLNLTFEKKGMTPSKSNIEVKKEDVTVSNDKPDWKVTINKKMFIITDATNGSRIDNYTITLPDIKGRSALDDKGFEIKASQANNIRIRVEAMSHDIYDKKINIVDQNVINIELKPKTKTYKFILPTTGEDLTISREVRLGDKPKSPVIGFKAVQFYNDSYKLEPTFNFKSLFTLIPMISALVVGIAIGIAIMIFKGSDNVDIEPIENTDTINVFKPLDTTNLDTTDSVTNGEESPLQDTDIASVTDKETEVVTKQETQTPKRTSVKNGDKQEEKKNGTIIGSNGNGGNLYGNGENHNGNGINSNIGNGYNGNNNAHNASQTHSNNR